MESNIPPVTVFKDRTGEKYYFDHMTLRMLIKAGLPITVFQDRPKSFEEADRRAGIVTVSAGPK